jgi:hypothetical protein
MKFANLVALVLSCALFALNVSTAAAACSSDSVYSSDACSAKCSTYGFGSVSSGSSNGAISCSCSGHSATYTGTFSCGPSSVSQYPLPSSQASGDTSATTGCSSDSVYSSDACSAKCSTYGFRSISSGSSNGAISCSCSGRSATYTGTFSCGPSSVSQYPLPASKTSGDTTAGQGQGCSFDCNPQWINDNDCDDACNSAACNWDGGDCNTSGQRQVCPPFVITNMDETFCDLLNRQCSYDLGYASVYMWGGTYQCRYCQNEASVSVMLDDSANEMEAAANAKDISYSGPIFGIYVGLAVVFRLICFMMSYCCLPKEEEKEVNSQGHFLSLLFLLGAYLRDIFRSRRCVQAHLHPDVKNTVWNILIFKRVRWRGSRRPSTTPV